MFNQRDECVHPFLFTASKEEHINILINMNEHIMSIDIRQNIMEIL